MVNQGAAADGIGKRTKYRVLAELGQGGTAVVYLAVAQGQRGFSKLVVLKALRGNLAEDLGFRRMFLQEARVAARLNHPCIVQTYEVLDDGGPPVIVMEYLQGQPLSKVYLRAQSGLPLAIRLRIIADATSGLHHAHELADFDGRPLGLVHRDISPQNVFITFEGRAKLLDFGIAKLTAAHPDTRTGVMKGKLRYMSPEQIQSGPIDRRADLYAVGVMLWEAATGQQMWKGQSEPAIMNRVLSADIPSPREFAPETPVALERICMTALARDPGQRYATAAELEAELESLLGELGNHVTNRTIGETISNLFVDVRERTKKVIEARLSKVTSLSVEEYDALDSPVMALGGIEDLPMRITDQTLIANTVISSVPNHTRRRYVVAAILGLGLVASVSWAVISTPWVNRPGDDAPSRGLVASAPGQVEGRWPGLTIGPLLVPTHPGGHEVASGNRTASAAGADRPPGMVRADPRRHDPGDEPPDRILDDEAPPLPTATLIPARLRRMRKANRVLGSPARTIGPLEANVARYRPGSSGSPNASNGIGAAPASIETPPQARPAGDCDPPYHLDSEGTKKFRLECL